MEHINLPVSVERTESMTDLIDAKGNTVIWQGSSFPEMDEIALALNQHDKLVAEREGLWHALLRAEQTFRNLASDGSIVTMGTSLEIARNELENMRDALKLGKTE